MPGKKRGGSHKDYLHNKSVHNPVLYEELRKEHHMSKRDAAIISNGVLNRAKPWHTKEAPSGEALGLPDYPDRLGGDKSGRPHSKAFKRRSKGGNGRAGR